MAEQHDRGQFSQAWPAVASAALRIAFGIIWAVGAAFTWSAQFATHYVGYLHNAAAGQPAWSAWWFDMWIAIVTPHALLFVWLTRVAETLLAIALLLGFARRTTYVLGALFSLLIWSTAEGFGGPYAVGAANMGNALTYVLIFIALIGINYRGGTSPYSLDYLIERRWPKWSRVAEWSRVTHLRDPHPSSVAAQMMATIGIALLVFFLIGGLHSTTHVTAASPQAAAAAVSPLSLASPKPIDHAYDAKLPPLQPGPSINVNLTVSNGKVEIASGVYYNAWTYNGSVPGPVIHVRQGQKVNVTLTNHGTMDHSIDFHAAEIAPNMAFVDIAPGKSIHFSFVANVVGAFVYHCETMPILLHTGNGMYGALIVSPKTPLPEAAASYVLVQSEWYTQQVAGNVMGPDYAKMQARQPDEVVFNGAAFQYAAHPLQAAAGQRVRLYVVDAGPNLWSSFHVIGAVFDKVYPDGNPAQALDNVSAYTLGPGQGAVFDLVMNQPGKYAFVDHNMADIMIGAQGVINVQGTNGAGAPKPDVTAAPPSSTPAAPASASASAAPAGPYKFDSAKGAALFATNCAACHQATGTGLPGAFPPLKGNPAVLNADPATQITTILHGLHGKAINGITYSGAMPPFAAQLNDTEIANIANHERTSWGNHGKLVTADEVKALRAQAGK